MAKPPKKITYQTADALFAVPPPPASPPPPTGLLDFADRDSCLRVLITLYGKPWPKGMLDDALAELRAAILAAGWSVARTDGMIAQAVIDSGWNNKEVGRKVKAAKEAAEAVPVKIDLSGALPTPKPSGGSGKLQLRGGVGG